MKYTVTLKLPFYLVDVFGETKFSGNQLAVVELVKPISITQMQKIAAEFNFSETTFVLRQKDESQGFSVRIFTPKKEIPFAGHPTLGTAFVINHFMQKAKSKHIILKLKIGDIQVEEDSSHEILWFKTLSANFANTHHAQDLAKILDLLPKDIDTQYPLQEVSLGISFLMIPLSSLDAVKKARINLSSYEAYFKGQTSLPVFIFCKETYSSKNDINSRMFAPCFGIIEDSATGSANACLGAYIVKHKYLKRKKSPLRIEQGYEINRKSLIHIKTKEQKQGMEIFVGGKVITVAEGYLH